MHEGTCRRNGSQGIEMNPMLTDEFISYITSVRRYSPRTQSIYSDILKEFSAFAGGRCGTGDVPDQCRMHVDGSPEHATDDRTLTEALTPTVLRDYEFHLAEDRHLGAKSINQQMSALSSFCRWMVRSGRLKSNPLAVVKRPRVEKRLPAFYRERSMSEYFQNTEYAASREALDDFLPVAARLSDSPRSSSAYKFAEDLYYRRLRRLIISILYSTGVRRAELIGLNVGSVDFSRSVMTVHGKGDKMREIPVTSSLSEEISLYLEAAESAAGRSRTSGEPLLTTVRGNRLYPMFVERAVRSELGMVDDITGRKSPHVLRHTLATELLNDGADIYSIKELLGHSSLAATQVYTHNTVEKLKKVYINAHPRAKRGGKDGD